MDSETLDERARILVVDDDEAIAELIKSTLEREGFEAQACFDSRQALASFKQNPFDLVILDVMMPHVDGYELCAKLRTMSEVPVLFLSAKSEESDQVVGFSLGADDYIAKPFRPRELVARVKARLRRSVLRNVAPKEAETSQLIVGDLVIDPLRHSTTLLGEPLSLTPTEFAIITELAKTPDTPVSSRDIFERIWHERADASAANTVMVHIRNLRRKLCAIEGTTIVIDNIWGVGYALRDKRS